MRVVITDVVTGKDQVIALGLASFMEEIGVRCDMGAAQTKTIANPAPAPAAPSVPATKVKRKAAPVESVSDAEPEAPRVTVRSRILAFLKSGSKTAVEVSREIGADPHNAGQHLYLMTRDKLTVRDEDTNTWRLA